jgi:hypothetical protein
VAVGHVAVRKDDLEGRIEGEKRLQQVLLIPEEVESLDKLSLVLERQKDVVDVDHYARLQPRQHLEKQEVDVAWSRNMGRVDEQVSFSQDQEGSRHVFPLLTWSRSEAVKPEAGSARVGFDTLDRPD